MLLVYCYYLDMVLAYCYFKVAYSLIASIIDLLLVLAFSTYYLGTTNVETLCNCDFFKNNFILHFRDFQQLS